MNDITRTSKKKLYTTETISGAPDDRDSISYRITDTSTDSRVATCYHPENALLVTAALNAYSAGEPRARDADLYEWASGLVEALNLAGITRAQGEEDIDTDYLAELHSRLSQPPSAIRLAQLENMRTLTDGWDSYGAQPIDPACIAKARELLHSLPGDWTPVPVSDGTVQLEQHADGFDLTLDVTPYSGTTKGVGHE